MRLATGGVIVRGDLVIPVGETAKFGIGPGLFFGEMGLVMGRRRNSDVIAGTGGATVIEIPRNAALKLIASSDTARKRMMDTIVLRKMQTFLSSDLTEADLAVIAALREDNPAERARLLAEAEGILLDKNGYIPLGVPVRWSLVRGGVDGLEANPTGFHPLFPLALRPI